MSEHCTTAGRIQPLVDSRLTINELFAELLSAEVAVAQVSGPNANTDDHGQLDAQLIDLLVRELAVLQELKRRRGPAVAVNETHRGREGGRKPAPQRSAEQRPTHGQDYSSDASRAGRRAPRSGVLDASGEGWSSGDTNGSVL